MAQRVQHTHELSAFNPAIAQLRNKPSFVTYFDLSMAINNVVSNEGI
jgi:hypothetical protein